jgi:predicted nucleotidyltransferase
MVPNPRPVDRALLEQVVQQIVRQFRPERVILFGSHAYGTPTVDSDVDLLVVLDTSEPLARCAVRVAAAVDHPFPLDIIVRTPDGLADACHRGATFATEILTRGVVLYEAGDGRVGAQGRERPEGEIPDPQPAHSRPIDSASSACRCG